MLKLIGINKPLLVAIAKHRGYIERRIPSSIDHATATCIVAPNFEAFGDLRAGTPFGLYHEPIVRIEVLPGKSPAPRWFNPKDNAGDQAVHSPLGVSAYIQVAIDAERRHAEHPFDSRIRANATSAPVQVGLFDLG